MTRPAALADLKKAVMIGLLSFDVEAGAIFTTRQRSGPGFGPPRRAERPMKAGYLRVFFTLDGELLHISAHKALWTWKAQQDVPPGFEVDHGDFVKTNNMPANLECVTQAENFARAVRAGRMCGGRPPKLSPEAVHAIRAARAFGESCVSIAARFGVTEKYVSALGTRLRRPDA